MALVHKRGRPKKTKARKTSAKRKVGAKRGRPRGRRCPTCGKILKTAAALKTHITRMHKGRRGRPAGKKTGRASPLDQRLMKLSLAEVADLHNACLKELGRRLADIVG
jgi:uncharacterized C2H2 Zn-finger protein